MTRPPVTTRLLITAVLVVALAVVRVASAVGSPNYAYESLIETVGQPAPEQPGIAGLATDGTGRLYAALPSAGVVKVFSDAAADNVPLATITKPNQDPFAPLSVAVSPVDETVYVADSGGNRVLGYKLVAGKYKLTYLRNLSSYAQMPLGVAVSSDDRLYVSIADKSDWDPSNRIMVFATKKDENLETDNGLIGCFGAGHFYKPVAITFDPAGHVFVVDSMKSAHHRVLAFAPYSSEDPECGVASDDDPTYLGSIGAEGGGPGQLFGPFGVAVDPLNRVHVAEAGNNRVQAFAPNQTAWGYLARFPEPALGQTGTEGGSGPGQLKGPTGLAMDGTRVYVADAQNNRIQRLRFDDADADGVFDTVDNCPGVPNPNQNDVCSAGSSGQPSEPPAVMPGAVQIADTTPPTSRIRRTRSLKSRRAIKARRLRSVMGTAHDAESGIARVQVAIARVRGKRCLWLTRSGVFLRSCAKPRFVNVRQPKRSGQASVSWRYQLSRRQRRALRRGKWRLVSRATDRAGNVEKARKRNRNLRMVRLR